jgi:cytochrome c biogenesis protein CcmG/thiol:disulfide interchange protein DsbE
MRPAKWFTIALLVLGATAYSDQPTDLKGKPAPDFSLKTLDGKQVKLSDQKGQVVLIDFWATWCPPFLISMSYVQKKSADEATAKKSLKIFAVNDKESADTVKAFMTKNKYTFIVPMDADQTACKAYSVSGIPTTVIIGRDGIITDTFVGFGDDSAQQIDAAIDKALAAK